MFSCNKPFAPFYVPLKPQIFVFEILSLKVLDKDLKSVLDRYSWFVDSLLSSKNVLDQFIETSDIV